MVGVFGILERTFTAENLKHLSAGFFILPGRSEGESDA
jgi:hypothetical protein